MPIYVYRCPTCGKTEEHIHDMSDKPRFLCEHPGDFNTYMKKVPHNKMGLHFKGSGFYSTDYKDK